MPASTEYTDSTMNVSNYAVVIMSRVPATTVFNATRSAPAQRLGGQGFDSRPKPQKDLSTAALLCQIHSMSMGIAFA